MNRLRFALLLSLCSCATTFNAKWAEAPASVSATQSDAVKALVADGEASWALREDQAKLKDAIAKWEAAGAQWADGALYSRLSRAHYFLADSFLALDTDAAARDAEYTAGHDWAVRALKLQAPEMVKGLGEGKTMPVALKLATQPASEALLWYAANLGKMAAQHGIATRLKYKDELKAIIDRVHEIDEAQHGATFRWLGGYEAQTMSLGGSSAKSEEFFKKSLEANPNFLGTKVLWAQLLCTKTGDRAKAKQLLNEVVAADPTLDPTNVAENKADQKKAAQLLANFDAMF